MAYLHFALHLVFLFLGSSQAMSVAFERNEASVPIPTKAPEIGKVAFTDEPQTEASFLRHRKLSFATDAMVALGAASSFTNLPDYANSDASTWVIQITDTILSGNIVACAVSSCTPNTMSSMFDVTFKFGSAPMNQDDGTRISDTGDNCPFTASVTATSDSTLYVMITTFNDPGVADASVTCTSNNTPQPTLAPTVDGGTQPPFTPAPTCSCFSEVATAQVQDKGMVRMKDLQINDKVLVGTMSDQPIYQSVYSFGHQDRDSDHEYLRIHTRNHGSKPLELSATHLIHLYQQKDPVRADSIQIGDMLISQSTAALGEPVQVTKIEKVTRKGAYMPLTKDGNIVVNNLLASAYVSVVENAPKIASRYRFLLTDESVLHWWLAPYRMFCLGTSSNLCQVVNKEGVLHWLDFGKDLVSLVDTWKPMYRFLGVVALVLFMAGCRALEVLAQFFLTVPGIFIGCWLLWATRRKTLGLPWKHLKNKIE